jgi:hypothetical protein
MPMMPDFTGLGPTPGSTALDAPPPSPTPMGEVDAAGPFSMRGLAGAVPGQVPAAGMPPEVLTGVQQSVSTMQSMLDSLTQVTPDQAGLLAMMKQMLQEYGQQVQVAGAGPTSPTAAGPAFPGGGIDRGLAGAGSI